MDKLIEIFLIFSKIGLYAFGGGPAMIPIMQGEVVEGKQWVSDTDFRTALSIGNSIPGPIAPELAMWVGYRVAGVPGATVAVIAVIFPGLFLMGVLSAFFWSNADSPYLKGAAKGAGIAVIGMLAYVTYDQAYKVFVKGSADNWLQGLSLHWDWVLIALAVFFAVLWRPNLMMPLVMLSAAAYGALFLR